MGGGVEIAMRVLNLSSKAWLITSAAAVVFASPALAYLGYQYVRRWIWGQADILRANLKELEPISEEEEEDAPPEKAVGSREQRVRMVS